MSKREQTLVEPQVIPGKASVTAYLNVYQQEDGNIKFGAKVFRKRANAERFGRDNVGPSTYLATVAVSHEVELV